MAPISFNIVSAFVNLNTNSEDWTSTIGGVSEQLQVMTENINTSAVWAWIVGFFAAIGSFFTTILPSVGEAAGHVWENLSKHWAEFSQFLLQHHIYQLVVVWFVVFWVVMLIPLALGFGTKGVLAGFLAAWFQCVIYGAFTPAGGILATLTSVGMMGCACPQAALPAVLAASLAATIAWGLQG